MECNPTHDVPLFDLRLFLTGLGESVTSIKSDNSDNSKTESNVPSVIRSYDKLSIDDEFRQKYKPIFFCIIYNII